MYDYLCVGAGLFSAVFAHEAHKRGKSVLVIEKRDHIGGNIYCQEEDGIYVHRYGAHIFHTSDREVWEYVSTLTPFLPYRHTVMANYEGKMYNMPFNMNTFSKMWNIATPDEAMAIIEEQKKAVLGTPSNLEEQAISMIGTDLYRVLVKGYTEKQWGRDCKDLPSFIIKRLPVRDTYDNSYFNDIYQGIPEGGYNKLIEALFEGCEIRTGVDFLEDPEGYKKMAAKIVYTGMIDAYYDYCFGHLNYRSLAFETERVETDNYQGTAVVNYTKREVPYTRIIEHKHFERRPEATGHTIITREYPAEWHEGMEPYYPVNDEANQKVYEQYAKKAQEEENVIFGGRLGEYRYYDMDKVVASALERVKIEFSEA